MKNLQPGHSGSGRISLATTNHSNSGTASCVAACPTRARLMMESVIHDTISWIENHLDGDLQVVKIAERAGYTRWHFQRMFKEITGHGLSDFVRHRRIEKAAQEIVSTDKNIGNIAYEYGYTTQQSLSRLIRHHYGMTPTEMRRQAVKKCGTVCQANKKAHS